MVLSSVGGAGNKFLANILGEAEIYFRGGRMHSSPSRSFDLAISKWDLCAGEACLLATGGQLRNLWGQLYKYTNDKETGLYGGVLATWNREFDEERIVKTFADFQPPA